MTIEVATEKVGARIYVVGNTYAIKDRLKGAGCHWDGGRKQWWIGAAKADKISGIVGQLDGQEVKEDLADSPVYGKVEYKGRTYYVIAQSERTGKLRLTVLDGGIDFWAAADQCRWVKQYEAREERGAYGRGTGRYSRQTLGGFRNFIRQRKRDESAVSRGEVPDGWCRDMEDGCIKPRSECDMPSE